MTELNMGLIETIQRAKTETATDAYPEYAGQSYRPGSGTEGVAFDSAWCAHCERDREFREAGADGDPAIACQIIADTFAFDIDDPRYPKEWVHDRDGHPRCTAFTDDPKKPIRCPHTLDLFGNQEVQ